MWTRICTSATLTEADTRRLFFNLKWTVLIQRSLSAIKVLQTSQTFSPGAFANEALINMTICIVIKSSFVNNSYCKMFFIKQFMVFFNELPWCFVSTPPLGEIGCTGARIPRQLSTSNYCANARSLLNVAFVAKIVSLSVCYVRAKIIISSYHKKIFSLLIIVATSLNACLGSGETAVTLFPHYLNNFVVISNWPIVDLENDHTN